ncbi:MAG: MFS transporter [Lachnospiraceae bacterium]|nr:MFS transporter [Lachnospiraceae bacterium]
MKNLKLWTLRYTLINVLYFVAFCTIHAYAAVFMLDKGFNNTQVGLALALSNILSVIGQPLVAGIIDKGKFLTNRLTVMFSSLFLLLGSIFLIFVNTEKVPIFVVFVLMYTVQFVYMPMMIAMNFEYAKAGCNINFGLARGLGSAGFAVTSFFLGKAVENFGTNVILYVTIVAMAIMVLHVFFFKKPKTEETSEVSEIIKEKKGSGGFISFIKKYPFFIVFLIGTACCFFAHNMINDFMIQIIRSLGGNETQLGYATFLQAILELPVMALIGYVLKKISERHMLVFSAVSFFIKTAILIFATSMIEMYVSQSFQMFAYAVFIPVAAYFADNVMMENDKVKGQAFINSAITLGGVFSNLICGKLLDVFGVKTMILTGVAVCLVGVVIVVIAIYPMMKKVPERA